MANIRTQDLGSKLDPGKTYIIEVGGRRKPSADGATVASTLLAWAGSAVPGTRALVIDAADGKAVGTVVAAESKDVEPEADREPEAETKKVVTSEAKVVNPPKRATRKPATKKASPRK
jgi:hypothetical protein